MSSFSPVIYGLVGLYNISLDMFSPASMPCTFNILTAWASIAVDPSQPVATNKRGASGSARPRLLLARSCRNRTGTGTGPVQSGTGITVPSVTTHQTPVHHVDLHSSPRQPSVTPAPTVRDARAFVASGGGGIWGGSEWGYSGASRRSKLPFCRASVGIGKSAANDALSPRLRYLGMSSSSSFGSQLRER